jgi:hypothetical protein
VAVGDVGELQPAAGTQDAADLRERRLLVGAEVDDAVGDDGVGPAVLDGELLEVALRISTWSRSSSSATARDRSIISWVMSTPITRPSRPTCSAAMKVSNPPPEPTSTTRSPGPSGRRTNGFPTPAKDSTARSGSESTTDAS